VKNWKTTIGGATDTLGKTLRGIPMAMVALNPQAAVNDPDAIGRYAGLYLAGLVVSAVGQFASDLFAQDKTTNTTEPQKP